MSAPSNDVPSMGLFVPGMLYEREIRRWLKNSPRKAKPLRVCKVKEQHLAVTGVSSGRKQVYLTDDLGIAEKDNAGFFADRDPHGLRLCIRKGDSCTLLGDWEQLCVHGRRAGIRHQVQGGDEPVEILQPALHGQGAAFQKGVVLAGIGSRMQPELCIAAKALQGGAGVLPFPAYGTVSQRNIPFSEVKVLLKGMFSLSKELVE